jgi:hypothetical protein
MDMEEAVETSCEDSLKLSLAQMETETGEHGVGLESSVGGQDTRRKWMAISQWQPESCLAEITTMKGNFWKVTGFNVGSHNYLADVGGARGGDCGAAPALPPSAADCAPGVSSDLHEAEGNC